ncbi:MAG TPA: hypothetical protein DCX01_10370 [Bacteroidetes bacterium]|nr:hypothetical protein [Bacteroidota bacterium]
MKKLFLLSLSLFTVAISCNGQISFDTTYHENLNVDGSQFGYEYKYFLTNNAVDPADTVFQWTITYKIKQKDWYDAVIVPLNSYSEPIDTYDFHLASDSEWFARLEFSNFTTLGYGRMTLKVTSKLHPNIWDTATLVIQTRNPVSIEQPNEFDFDVYPNPVSDYLNVKSEPGATYKLTNMLGNSVYEGTLYQRNNVLDVSDCTSGVYYLKVRKDNSSKVVKVLVGSR